MTKPITPEQPRFIMNATATQKWMAGIAVSIFITVWVTGWQIVVNIFKPDFVSALTYLRMTLGLVGITITAFVGYEQIKRMLDWLVDSWEIYKKMTEFKNSKKE